MIKLLSLKPLMPSSSWDKMANSVSEYDMVLTSQSRASGC